MAELLTAREVQEMLNVDRSTVYRMAEDGRLPAVKVGKQWRFPREKVEAVFGFSSNVAEPVKNSGVGETAVAEKDSKSLAALLPLDCVQLIQDTFANLLGVMIIITDMTGMPITEPSNSCGLFGLVNQTPDAVQRCIQSWHNLAESLDLQPKLMKSHLDLLCTRGLIRVGTELKGMVVAGCIKPEIWPPSPERIAQLAAEFGVEPDLMTQHIDEAFELNDSQKKNLLGTIQEVANIVAHIVKERQELVTRLDKIADLTRL